MLLYVSLYKFKHSLIFLCENYCKKIYFFKNSQITEKEDDIFNDTLSKNTNKRRNSMKFIQNYIRKK